jgi:hypothetical protein
MGRCEPVVKGKGKRPQEPTGGRAAHCVDEQVDVIDNVFGCSLV